MSYGRPAGIRYGLWLQRRDVAHSDSSQTTLWVFLQEPLLGVSVGDEIGLDQSKLP